ncbi:MAG: Uncharacterized protein FD165_2619 [Gammaproteobacteria bacterium]|nr:MAG: Uncharacterized protein FD165_2619 [Gammaproteobacteria bacterium]TND01592.1 MAG: Uncharacterized protein FD120_2540 [Gammaproteobacteria bacterium]
MSGRGKAVLLFVALYASVTHAAENSPKKIHVALQEFTTITIDLVPDLGTRLVFPFVLDETGKDGAIPFTMNITNPVFHADRQPGRNIVVITAPPPADGGDMSGYLGDLFISVAGYNITARLRTVKDWRKQYDDVVFDLSEDDRQRLVDDEVRRRSGVIEEEFRRKQADLDKEAERRALAKVGYLAMQGARESRVREKAKQVFPNGDQLVLYVDTVRGYGPFSVIPVEITANTVGAVQIIDTKLFGKASSDAPEQEIPASYHMTRRLEPGDTITGSVSVDHPNIMDMYSLKLVVLTDKGTAELKW